MARKFRTEIDKTKIVVDSETGEVISMLARKVCETQEEFVKIYMNNIDDLITLDNTMLKVLMVCLKEAKFSNEDDHEGNILYNSKQLKEKCKKMIKEDFSPGEVNVYIHRLASAGILLRKSRGEYYLNPRYFVKGKLNPKTRMQLVVEYEGK